MLLLIAGRLVAVRRVGHVVFRNVVPLILHIFVQPEVRREKDRVMRLSLKPKRLVVRTTGCVHAPLIDRLRSVVPKTVIPFLRYSPEQRRNWEW